MSVGSNRLLHLPSAPCSLPQFPCSQRSLEALRCPRSAGVILSQHSGQVWGAVLHPTSHHPIIPSSSLPPSTPQTNGIRDGGWGCRAPSLPGLDTPNPAGDTPQPPSRGLPAPPARGFQASRWRCATARRELPTHTRLRSRAPGMSPGKTLPVCAGLTAPSPGWHPRDGHSLERGRGKRIFGRQVEGEDPASGTSCPFGATEKKGMCRDIPVGLWLWSALV